MTSQNTAYARMLRKQKPKRGAAHVLMEELADRLFRGPAKTDHDIDLVVLSAAAQQLSQNKVLEQLPQAAVPHIISKLGADDPATGLLVFDGVLADALIEKQTLGRVSSASRVERAVTAIDAALSSAFATSIITKLAELTEDKSFATALQGYNCGRPQIDRAALSLALSGEAYDVMRVELDLGPGLKRGQAQLIVPASVISETAKPKLPAKNPEMVETLQEATMALLVQLPTVKLSLKTLLSLKPDSVITLAPEALAKARVLDVRHCKLATAKLGQFQGKRAVRLEPDPSMFRPKGTPSQEAPTPALTVVGDQMPISAQGDGASDPVEQTNAKTTDEGNLPTAQAS